MICLYLWVVAQIVLESFPISSSGHAQLLAAFCPLPMMSPSILKAFDFFLHLPTVCIVALFFRNEWLLPFRHIRRCWHLILKITSFAALATLITGVGYIIKNAVILPAIPIWVGFFITAVSLLCLPLIPQHPYATLDFKKTVCLSLVQACALVPGISRFGLTFVTARLLGISKRRAFEISFLLQWPLILCASLYGSYILMTQADELLNPILMSVMLGSSGIAYAGLYLQKHMIQKNTLWLWGIYMIIPLLAAIFFGSYA